MKKNTSLSGLKSFFSPKKITDLKTEIRQLLENYSSNQANYFLTYLITSPSKAKEKFDYLTTVENKTDLSTRILQHHDHAAAKQYCILLKTLIEGDDTININEIFNHLKEKKILSPKHIEPSYHILSLLEKLVEKGLNPIYLLDLLQDKNKNDKNLGLLMCQHTWMSSEEKNEGRYIQLLKKIAEKVQYNDKKNMVTLYNLIITLWKKQNAYYHKELSTLWLGCLAKILESNDSYYLPFIDIGYLAVYKKEIIEILKNLPLEKRIFQYRYCLNPNINTLLKLIIWHPIGPTNTKLGHGSLKTIAALLAADEKKLEEKKAKKIEENKEQLIKIKTEKPALEGIASVSQIIPTEVKEEAAESLNAIYASGWKHKYFNLYQLFSTKDSVNYPPFATVDQMLGLETSLGTFVQPKADLIEFPSEQEKIEVKEEAKYDPISSSPSLIFFPPVPTEEPETKASFTIGHCTTGTMCYYKE